MDTAFEHACWRGMEMDHPADWELVAVSSPGEPGLCVFADRLQERMKVRWRPFKRAPNLRRLMELKQVEKGRKIEALRDGPEGWMGTVETVGDGCVAHAGRFLDDSRTLLEVILVWPEGRDRGMERRILGSLREAALAGGRRPWQAMGTRLQVPGEWDLADFRPDVGRVAWRFGMRSRELPALTVRRIAIPRYWLNLPLEEWLVAEQEPGRRVTLQRRVLHNGHGAARVSSTAVGRGVERLRGRRRVRTDLAWRCPVEERVYHVRYEEATAGSELEIPAGLEIRCCQPYVFWGKKKGKATAREVPDTPESALDILGAVPHVNRSAKVNRGSRGGAMVEVQVKRPGYLVPPLSWVLPFSGQRRVQLDVLGMTMLDLCDGERTVEDVMEYFARENKLSFREAQLPVMQFVRSLSQRGILVLVGRRGKPLQ